MCGEYLLIGENGAWKMPSKGLTAQRQGSTSVTSLKNCNIPNVTTNTTYLAVLPPVLNIFPVSCTLEAQQMEIAIGEKCFKLKPGTVRNFQMHLILGIHNACAIPRH